MTPVTLYGPAPSPSIQAQEKLAPFDPYMDTVEVGLRVSELFKGLSEFMNDGAADKGRLGELALEQGLISATLKLELFGPD